MAESYNHGTKTTKNGKFTTLESFGKDDSDWTGSAADERQPKMGGGTTDVSHSISGSKANQSGS